MNSVLLDSGVFLLLSVGSAQHAFVQSHRRTKGEFSEQDFTDLLNFLKGFTTLCVTARCIAETSNLIRYDRICAPACMAWLKDVFGSGLGEQFREGYVRFPILAQSRHFEELGVADTSVLQYAQHVSMTVTCDSKLYGIISHEGYPVVLLEHILAVARTS